MQLWILSEESQAEQAALLLQALQGFKEGKVEEEGETKVLAIWSIPFKRNVSHKSLKRRYLSAIFVN